MKYFLIFSLLCVFACKQQSHNYYTQIDSYIKEYVDRDLFSGVVLVAENYKPVFEKAYGKAKHETNTYNNTATLFDIGSINKSFTKTMALQLAAENRLKLNDKLGTYLKGFPQEIAGKVQINHILNHSAGFGDYTMNPYFFQNLNLSMDEILAHIKTQPLLFDPGTEQSYSNSGYIVLGALIESMTDKSYEQNLQESILSLLNMKHTFYSGRDTLTNRAVGYMKKPDGSLEDTGKFNENVSPAGGAFSTASDLLTFYDALINSEKLLSDDYKPMLFSDTPKPEKSWLEIKTNPRAVFGFAGGHEGWNTLVLMELNKSRVIIVMSNYDEPISEIVGKNISRILNGEKPEPPKARPMQAIYSFLQNNNFSAEKNNYLQFLKSEDIGNEPFLLNMIGYFLLGNENYDAVIAVFTLNTELFPDEGNPWDSLAEAYMLSGDHKKAIKFYKKSLELDPENENAKDKIKEMTKK